MYKALAGLAVLVALIAGVYYVGDRAGSASQAKTDAKTIKAAQDAVTELQARYDKAQIDHASKISDIEHKTNDELAALAATYEGAIANEKAKSVAINADLESGRRQLRVTLNALSRVQGSNTAASQPADSSTGTLARSVASHLESYCVGEFNELRSQVIQANGIIAEDRKACAGN